MTGQGTDSTTEETKRRKFWLDTVEACYTNGLIFDYGRHPAEYDALLRAGADYLEESE